MRSGWIVGLLSVAGATWLASFGLEFVRMGSGFIAHSVCSSVFVSGRSFEQAVEDAAAGNGPAVRLFSAAFDQPGREVVVRTLGVKVRSARYDASHGCRLDPKPQHNPVAQKPVAPPADAAEWPAGALVDDRPRLDAAGTALGRAIDRAFAEPASEPTLRTRAVVVVQRGRIVGERYAAGFGPETPMLGWSMTKTVTAALVGIAVGRGDLSLDQRANLPEFRQPGDPRTAITVGDLLRLESGLAFHENYTAPLSDVRRMLYTSPSASGYAAAMPLETKPGTAWRVSSGDPNIASRVLRNTFAGREDAYLAMPRERLFGPIGMRTAVLETDPDGTFVGSSFLYASARDWARFGFLLLQDGRWGEAQVLPPGWVDEMKRPTTTSGGQYGAGLWRKIPGADPSLAARIPADAYFMRGFDGQLVAVIPSRALVVVRLGLTRPTEAFKGDAFLVDILDALAHGAECVPGNQSPESPRADDCVAARGQGT